MAKSAPSQQRENRSRIARRVPPTVKDELESAIVVSAGITKKLRRMAAIARQRYDKELALLCAELAADHAAVERRIRNAYEGRRGENE
ncbi:MAG: hypothetical protein H6642_00075 [Caldilineaceae bacterium]|nr:hypothetical protein [Caldilineaceae bacterium]